MQEYEKDYFWIGYSEKKLNKFWNQPKDTEIVFKGHHESRSMSNGGLRIWIRIVEAWKGYLSPTEVTLLFKTSTIHSMKKSKFPFFF